jgi:hypothetical protein
LTELLPPLRPALFRSAKQIAAQLGPWVPGSVGRLPYLAALASLRTALRATWSGPIEIWSRNSLLTQSFTPGVSDLDLTVWLRHTPSRNDMACLRRVLTRARSVFPWIGEANVYVSSEIRALASLFNPLELARDPELRQRLGSASRTLPIEAEQTAFLARMLERDVEGLRLRSPTREAKWALHFEATGISKEALSGSGPLLNRILNTLFLRLDDGEPGQDERRRQYLAAMTDYLDGIALGPSKIDYGLGHRPWTYALFANRLCGAEPPPALSPRLAAVAASQVAWEVCGLYSQLHEQAQDPALIPHLERLELVLQGLERHPFLAAGLLEIRSGLQRVAQAVRARL